MITHKYRIMKIHLIKYRKLLGSEIAAKLVKLACKVSPSFMIRLEKEIILKHYIEESVYDW